MESFAERAGVQFVTPHPTRVMRDTSRPLHDLNNNQGPEWIGYWDIVRYADINTEMQLLGTQIRLVTQTAYPLYIIPMQTSLVITLRMI